MLRQKRMWRLTTSLTLIAALLACSSDRSLPSDFTYGTAVAGFQVDMGCPTIAAELCEDRGSDWYAYITSTAAIARTQTHLAGDPPSRGPGFFELYPQDLDRAQSIGTNGFRFSIEWSRVFPESTVGIEDAAALDARANPAAMQYYRDLLAAVKARGLKPLVTLHHYTLPAWIHDGAGCTLDLDRCSPKGWLEPGITHEIAKYAGFVARHFGAEVDQWATLNEPLAVVIPGFLMPTAARTNPPAQLLRYAEAKTAIFAMINAHAKMVDAVRAADTIDADGDGRATFVGVVYPVAPVVPKDPSSALDVRAAENISYVYNDIFLNAVIRGVLDEDINGSGEVKPELVGRSDYLGLNYYFKVVVKGETSSFLPDFSPLLTFDPLALEQGAVHPSGLRDTLARVKSSWPDVPIYITENGWDHASGYGQDKFLAEHLGYMLRAIHEDGVDVRGYYWWSLIDNYEWNHGMAMKFGMWAVDPMDPTKARTPRPVAEAYRSVIEEGGLPDALAEKFPISEE